MSLSKYNKTTKELEPIAGGFDVQGILDDIGDLTELDTSTKTDLVSAVNEVKGDIPTKTSDLTNNSGFVGLGETSSTAYAGDKGKANTSAIEAIVNVTGSCNIFPIGNTQTIHGRTFTVNSDGSITVSGSGDGVNAFYIVTPQKLNVDDHYILKGCPSGGSEGSYSLMYSNTVDNNYSDYGDGVEFVPFDYTIYPTQSVAIYINGNYVIQGTLTFDPMLYDARLNPTGYVPYAMTNRELTERVKLLTIPVLSVNIGAGSSYVLYNNPCPTGYIPISAMFDRGVVSNDPVLLTVYLDSGTDVRVNMYNFSNSSIELNGSVKVLCIKA